MDGINGPQVIPPAYGLLGINRITATGDGDQISYWNRYVAVTQMGGHGTFQEPRTGVSVTNGTDDLVSSQIAALAGVPAEPARSRAAGGQLRRRRPRNGVRQVFNGAGQCAKCHSGTTFTDANSKLHDPSEVVSEPEPNGVPSYASRSATKKYRTAPLHGLWQHPPYFHNGSAPTLEAVVDTYDTKKGLGLTPDQKADLVQYLKSL